MTTAERLERLEKMLGVDHLGKSSVELAQSLTPESELDGGRYPYILSDYQMRIGLAEINSGLQNKILEQAAIISSQAERITALEARPTTGTSIAGGSDLVSYGNGELHFIHRDIGGSRQGNIRGDFKVKFGVNGYDYGARVLRNWNHEGTRYLPYDTYGVDSRGAFSYNWFPAELGGEYPDNAPAAVHSDPNHPLYWPYRGQALVIDGGGQAAYGYLTGHQLYNGRNVLIAAQRGGQSIYFCVTPERNANQTAVQNRALMKLESSAAWSPNPVHIVIDGELRRLRSTVIDGQNVVCF